MKTAVEEKNNKYNLKKYDIKAYVDNDIIDISDDDDDVTVVKDDKTKPKEEKGKDQEDRNKHHSMRTMEQSGRYTLGTVKNAVEIEDKEKISFIIKGSRGRQCILLYVLNLSSINMCPKFCFIKFYYYLKNQLYVALLEKEL